MSTDTLPSVQKPASVELIAQGESWWDDKAKFELIQRAAKMFASSPLVPQQYQGAAGLGSCVIALNMAQRMGADPLMVMQNLYVVHGRPSWSAQFLIACFNQTGRFSPIRYQWSGTEGKDDWGCTAWSTDRETGEKIEGPLITIKMAKDEKWYEKAGSKWKTIPRLMLMYRAASWLVRTHAPELAMGLRSSEEEHDIGPSQFSSPPANGSRSSQVADLLGGAPVNDVPAPGSSADLANSIYQRIQDANSPDEFDALRKEIDHADKQQMLTVDEVQMLCDGLEAKSAVPA